MANYKGEWILLMVLWLAISGFISTTIETRTSVASDRSRYFSATGKTASGRLLNYWNGLL
jgi:hypothetical protein